MGHETKSNNHVPSGTGGMKRSSFVIGCVDALRID